METIRNYLESMFRSMPNTPEVRRAKDELLQMMEDKYMELMSEGMTENAAVGTVISEFGNLDELSESLGISHFLPERIENIERQGRTLLIDEVKDYLRDDRKTCVIRALGIFCFIISPTGPILADGIFGGRGLIEGIGTGMLFLLAAAGVFLIIYAGNLEKKWKYIRKVPCCIDYSTAAWLEEMITQNEPKMSMIRILGIICCILALVPVVVLDSIRIFHDFFSAIGTVLMFVIVGIGVMLILFSSGYLSAAKKLLHLNDKQTIGGQYTRMQQEQNESGKKEGILSVYWPTVTCIYLCASFLTFSWGITWIIWPVAAIIHSVIKMNRKAAMNR